MKTQVTFTSRCRPIHVASERIITNETERDSLRLGHRLAALFTVTLLNVGFLDVM